MRIHGFIMDAYTAPQYNNVARVQISMFKKTHKTVYPNET